MSILGAPVSRQLSSPNQVKPHPRHQPPPSQTPSRNLSLNKNSTRTTVLDNASNRSKQRPPIDPTVLYTSTIARRCRTGHLDKAVSEFTAMRLAGVDPNHVTFITLLSACKDSKLRRFGSSVHGMVRKLESLDVRNVMVGTAAVEMYAKSGDVDAARKLFDKMSVRNNVSWNAMIDGYMRNGRFEDAVELFDEMPDQGVISWTALINGFVKGGHFEQALVCFRDMQMSDVEPDYVTVMSVLAACANLGMLWLGMWVNRFILKHHEFLDNVKVNNSLIDMYSRCGRVEYARQVFQTMTERSLVSWNSIIVGFAVNGHAEEALEFFDLMQKEGFQPDGVTLTGALTACSHAGLVNEGIQLFDNMERRYKVTPRMEHYGCIVDMYSRAGRLDEAWNVIYNMPIRPNEVVLGSLLAACRPQDVELAERIMKRLVKLDPSADSNYVLLSNIYAGVGKWDGANRVRRRMKNLGVQKTPGISTVEIGFNVHEFTSSDRSHEETNAIYQLLDHLSYEMKLHGNVPEHNTHE